MKLVLVEDELVALVHIAPRKELRLKEESLVKLLELNGADGFAKFAPNDDSLYARIDAHARLLDVQELKYAIEQISGAADDAYPKIKDYVTGANEPAPAH